jgi:hypothetical protein
MSQLEKWSVVVNKERTLIFCVANEVPTTTDEIICDLEKPEVSFCENGNELFPQKVFQERLCCM